MTSRSAASPATTVEVSHPLQARIFTPDACALIAALSRAHTHTLTALLDARAERAWAIGTPLAPPAETEAVRAADWSVAAPPADLRDRRVEITGPAEPKMMIGALNSGANVFMADLEDSLSPTWDNIVGGHVALAAAAAGTLSFTRDDGRVDTVGPEPATLCVRPRGLHLPETRVSVDGAAVPAALFDLAMLVSHTAPGLTARGSGLYLYLPKLQSRHEAEWWDAVIADAERRTGLAPRSIRVTVLVEHIHAAVEMEEILFALRDRITGLNAGRWDYLFSIIKVLGADPAHVLPDRLSVSMRVPFLAAYAQQLVEVCHRRGAYAIGGMSAFVPNRRDEAATEHAFTAVRADKEREAALGYDGTWVAHPDLVAVARDAFDVRLGGADDQRQVRPAPVAWSALSDTLTPELRCTRAGLENDLRVAMLYVGAWLGGRGAVAIDSLMEDAATAEIARCQVWQWRHHGITLDDGTVVTAAVVTDEIGRIAQALRDEPGDGAVLEHLAAAVDVIRACVLAEELPEFLTLLALDRLDPHG